MSVPWNDERLDRPELTGWTARRLEDPPGWHLEGPCPKCAHQVRETWLDDVVRGTEVQRLEPEGPVTTVVVRCRCSDPGSHGDDRPGCGRSWTIEIHR